MAGGVGERFWPVSRQDNPKQFLSLSNENTLLEATFERAKKIVSPERIFIITTEQYVEKIQLLLPIPKENVIGEPCGRNTAPCLGLSVSILMERLGDDTVAVLPSDHLILDEEGFLREMFNAFDFLSKHDGTITFGIIPTRPETGYGYIHRDQEIVDNMPYSIYKALKFVEKPRLEKAQEYVRSGMYLWNSGMFVFKASYFINLFKTCLPNIYDGIVNIILKTEDIAIKRRTYECFPSISVDYGIMENSKEIYVLAVQFPWNDLGNWLSFENVFDPDRDGNIVIKGDFISIDTKDSIVYADEGLIAAVGVKNLIIAKSGNSLLVCDKEHSQEIKNLVKKLETSGHEKYR